jgi:polyphenol oxidase
MIEAETLAGFRHGFFTRRGGHSTGVFASLNCGYGSGDDKALVGRNRALVAEQLGVAADRLLTVWQCHSADAVTVSEPWAANSPPHADAMVTATPGVAVAVLAADCTPVLFAEREARVVGAAHAGWKGALTGILEATLAAMERLGARRERIAAVIGPTISQASYETGPEFIDHFVDADRANKRFFRPSTRPYHNQFDLPGYVGRRLAAAGCGVVRDLALCTYADQDRFFSFRRTTHCREPDYGRQISAIALSPLETPNRLPT